MLDHPKHRVGDAVDIREETLCDDRNAHTKRVPAAAVAKVASRNMTRELPVGRKSPENASYVRRSPVGWVVTRGKDAT
jgi:hypothetical protein